MVVRMVSSANAHGTRLNRNVPLPATSGSMMRFLMPHCLSSIGEQTGGTHYYAGFAITAIPSADRTGPSRWCRSAPYGDCGPGLVKKRLLSAGENLVAAPSAIFKTILSQPLQVSPAASAILSRARARDPARFLTQKFQIRLAGASDRPPRSWRSPVRRRCRRRPCRIAASDDGAHRAA
jgi:hypothetical protein